MRGEELNQAVCNATGESQEQIKAMGFQLLFKRPFVPLPPELQKRRVFSSNVTDINMNPAA